MDQDDCASWRDVRHSSFLVVGRNVDIVDTECVRLGVGDGYILGRGSNRCLGVTPGAAVRSREVRWIGGRHFQKSEVKD